MNKKIFLNFAESPKQQKMFLILKIGLFVFSEVPL